MKIRLKKPVTSKKAARPKAAPRKSVSGSRTAKMTPALKRLVSDVDAAERALEEAETALSEALTDLKAALDGYTTFDHPTRGPTSVMERGGKVFWRSKPEGRPA